jgi:hypothetical protein
MGLLLFSAVVAVAMLSHVKQARATPAAGFVGTTIAQGTLAEFEVFNHFVLPPPK